MLLLRISKNRKLLLIFRTVPCNCTGVQQHQPQISLCVSMCMSRSCTSVLAPDESRVPILDRPSSAILLASCKVCTRPQSWVCQCAYWVANTVCLSVSGRAQSSIELAESHGARIVKGGGRREQQYLSPAIIFRLANNNHPITLLEADLILLCQRSSISFSASIITRSLLPRFIIIDKTFHTPPLCHSQTLLPQGSSSSLSSHSRRSPRYSS